MLRNGGNSGGLFSMLFEQIIANVTAAGNVESNDSESGSETTTRIEQDLEDDWEMDIGIRGYLRSQQDRWGHNGNGSHAGYCDPCHNLFYGLFCGLRQRRLLHDVIPIPRDRDADEIVSRLLLGAAGQRREGITIISTHFTNPNWKHLHVLHDCSWSNRSCRCAFLCGSDIKHRNRRAVWCCDLSFGAFRNIAAYILQKPREVCYLSIAGVQWRSSSGYPDLYRCRCPEGHSGQAMDGGNEEISVCDEGAGGSTATTVCGTRKRRDNQSETGGQLREYAREDKLMEFIKGHICVPLTNIVMGEAWLRSEYKYRGRNWEPLQAVMNVFYMNLMSMTLQEIGSAINVQSCRFSAIMGDAFEYYYSPEESIAIIEDLLQYQTNGQVQEFKQQVMDIVDKRIPKLNCLQIIGETCAGKNFFFDCLTDALLNKGCIGNFNRFCNFPLQEAKDRRILVWNEPNFESSAIETLKLMCGGDSLTARIKFQGDVIIHRTPIIMLTNYNVIPISDEAFVSRVKTMYWKSYSKLKEYSKKPFPGIMYHYMYN